MLDQLQHKIVPRLEAAFNSLVTSQVTPTIIHLESNLPVVLNFRSPSWTKLRAAAHHASASHERIGRDSPPPHFGETNPVAARLIRKSNRLTCQGIVISGEFWLSARRAHVPQAGKSITLSPDSSGEQGTRRSQTWFGVPDLWERPAQTLPQTLLVIQIWREHALPGIRPIGSGSANALERRVFRR